MSETKTHLMKLHTYVSKCLFDKPGSRCIRNELMTKYLEDGCDDSDIQTNKTCPRCFNTWNEGDFSVRIKPKQSNKSNSKKNVIMKCSVCNKRCTIEHSLRERKPAKKKSNKAAKIDFRPLKEESKNKTTTKRKKRKIKVPSQSHPNHKSSTGFKKKTDQKKSERRFLNKSYPGINTKSLGARSLQI